MSTPITTPAPAPEKKRKPWLWPVVAGVGALIIGIGIGAAAGGGSSSAATPTPAKTITQTETVEVSDELCKAVATELYSILQATTDELMIPYSDVTAILLDSLMNGLDVDEINRGTAILDGITTDASNLTVRITALQGDYAECTS